MIRFITQFCVRRGLPAGLLILLTIASGEGLAATMTRTPSSCVSVAGGELAWDDANDARTSNNNRASAGPLNGTSTNYLQCTGYNFSIPAGARIDGVVVTVERRVTSTFLTGATRDAEVRIVKAGAIGTEDRATTTTYTTTEVAEDHGDVNDLWGQTWTAAEINAANFGAAFKATKPTVFFSTNVEVDLIEITVSYTTDVTPPTISGVTSYCGGINQLLVNFSEALNPASAQTAGNYTLSGGVTVASATLQPDGSSVLLRTSTLNPGSYTLSVSGVRDASMNLIAPGSQSSVSVNGIITPGMRGAYHSGMSDQFPGTPVVRVDSTINFDWVNAAPVTGIPADQFSVRWTGFILPPVTGNYVLRTRSDDGVRLYLNGQILINNWTDHSAANNDSAVQSLTGGQYYALQMDYYENGGQAVAQLYGNYNNTGFQIVPAGYLFHCQIPTIVTPGRFNAFDPGTAAGATSGSITTKVAATAFNLDLVALNTATPSAIHTNFTGDVKVELLGNLATGVGLDANNCPQTSTVLGTSTAAFAAPDSGRKANVAFNTASYAGVTNAWRDVRVRITYPATGTATVVSCSGDNFAIKPASFSNVLARDQDWATAGVTRSLNNISVTGGNVHKAGRPFSISAEARNSAGAITTNYNGTPSVGAVSCNGSGSACTVGVGTISAASWTAAAGVVSTGTAIYSEVGSFGLQLQDTSFASVDTSDGSTAAQRNVPVSTTLLVGRFVPDHFTVATSGTAPVFKTFNETAAACASRSFTYIGQPFGYVTVPRALITAHNGIVGTNGEYGTTRNYQGAWWKIAGAGVQQTYSSVSGTISGVTLTPPAVVALNNNTGTGTITVDGGDLIKFDRHSTTPQALFNANIVLTIAASDTSELANGTITSTTPAVFNGTGAGMAFDSGNQFRYGILRLTNAHGSELLQLPVPAEVQFWNGSNFVLNAADSCTSLAPANVSLSNFQRNLAACETAATINGRFAGGRSNLVMTAPGAGNNGSVDLRVNLDSASGNACVPPNTNVVATTAAKDYLRAKSATGYNADPTARASFGVRRTGPVIYIRENYFFN